MITLSFPIGTGNGDDESGRRVLYSDFFRPDVTLLDEQGIFSLNRRLRSVLLLDPDGTVLASGHEWFVHPRRTYTILCEFSPGDEPFPDDAPLVFSLPGGLLPVRDSIVSTAGSTALDETNHKIYITPDAPLPDTIELSFDAQVAEGAASLSFGGAEPVSISWEEEPFLTADGKDYTLRICPAPGEAFPEGAEAVVREMPGDAAYQTAITGQLDISERDITFLRLFDISLLVSGETYTPQSPVLVQVDLPVEGEHVAALHFVSAPQPVRLTGAGASRNRMLAAPIRQVEALETQVTGQTVQFTTGSFSVFAIVGYSLEKTVTAGDGTTYHALPSARTGV